MKEQVEKVLKDIRPMLQADRGDIELLGVEEGVAKVRLSGACHGCPMSQITLQMTVEKILKQKVPGLKGVKSV